MNANTLLKSSGLVNLASMRADDLKRLLPLVEERDRLTQQLQKIDELIAALDKTAAVLGLSGLKKFTRGKLTEKMVKALKRYGPQGATVPELAADLGCPAQTVYNWCYSAKKKNLAEQVAYGVWRFKFGAEQP
jgi:DNA-binding IclR family transcriptional regulator